MKENAKKQDTKKEIKSKTKRGKRKKTENGKKRDEKSRYEIDLRGVLTKEQFHDRIQEALPCPAYYGRNLDALYDMLTESGEERELVFSHCEDFACELPGYFAALRELCGEAMEECGKLRILFEE